MGSGILRAVGDSRHPLLYLAVASIVNIILDFTFVCGFHMGIAGVAIATIMAQAVSSFMVMHKLMHTRGAVLYQPVRNGCHGRIFRYPED